MFEPKSDKTRPAPFGFRWVFMREWQYLKRLFGPLVPAQFQEFPIEPKKRS
jgi:hypothetical protein